MIPDLCILIKTVLYIIIYRQGKFYLVYHHTEYSIRPNYRTVRLGFFFKITGNTLLW